MARNWANLPNEICEVVLNRLCIIDIASFKSVCQGWYSATQESSNLSLLKPVSSPPWLTILPHKSSFYDVTNNKLRHYTTPVPNKRRAVCVGSGHGWLAFIDSRCVIYLVNPFTFATIQLPPIETLPDILSSSSLSPNGDDVDFTYWNLYEHRIYQISSTQLFDNYLVKLVMSSVPSETTTVMICHGNDQHVKQLAVCRIGDDSWTSLDREVDDRCDIYYSDTTHQFHVLFGEVYNWYVEVWDLSDFSSPKGSCIDFQVDLSTSEAEQTLLTDCFPKMYMAELYGNLLVVVRHHSENELSPSYKTLYFTVYKLDRIKKEWTIIKSLGDKGDGVIFLGINNALAFSAYDFLGLQHSSIYFTDDSFERHFCHNCTGHDLGVFNLTDNSIRSLYYHGDFQELLPLPVWISPNPW